MAAPSNRDELGQPIPPSDPHNLQPSRVVRRHDVQIPRPGKMPAEAASFLKQKRPRPSATLPDPSREGSPQGNTGKVAEFGSYSVLGRIAHGPDSSLFLAELPRPPEKSRRIALKLLSPAVSRTPSARRQLLEQALRASHISHEQLCQTYEAGAIGGAVYLAQEWLDGQNLPELMAALSHSGEGLTPALIAYVVAQAAHALDGAHRTRDARGSLLDIVHGRLHPGEIMITVDGDVKLLGFGMPAPAAPNDEIEDPTARGKLGYRAPEQLRDGTADARSDIFALGVILYELLTGSRLHNRTTVRGTVSAVLSERPTSIRASLPELPELLDVIVLRALEKRPEHRFQRASEIATALEAYLVSQPESVSPRRLARLMVRLFPQRGSQALSREPAALAALTVAEIESVRPSRLSKGAQRIRRSLAFALGLLTLALIALTAFGVIGLGR